MTDTRRTFLKRASIATALTTGLAGCSGDGGDGSGDGNGSGDSGSGSGSGDSGSGSGGNGDTENEQRVVDGEGEIHVLSAENSTAFKDYYQKWAERFNEETGYGVRLEFAGVGASQSQRISQLLQAGSPPELTTTAPEKSGGLALQGVLADLSEQVSWMEDLYGYSFRDDFLFSLEDSQYIVPIWLNMTMDWYRVSTWEEEAGMTPSELTWDEFRGALESTHEVDDRAGHVIAASEELMSSEFYVDYMFQNGGQIFDRQDGEVQVVFDQGDNRERTRGALEYLQDAQQFSLDGSGYGYSQQIESYWSEQVNEVKYFGARPLQQAVANNEAVAEDTGLMHPPYKEEKTHQAFSEGWIMFQGADEQEGAREFIEFMSRTEPLYELLHLAPLHNMPPFPEAVEDEEFLDNDFINTWVRPNDNILIDDVLEMVDTARTLNGETDPNNPLSSPVFSDGAFGNMIFEVLHNDVSIDDAIDSAAQRANSVMQNFQQ